MNLLAHLYLADLTDTSAAGQLLGDMVKGRLDGRYETSIEIGIRLHRRIDSFTDNHPVTTQLRYRFEPPFRRYAGILIDVGFDHCLATHWADYRVEALGGFATRIMAQARREWPRNAPIPSQRLANLERVLTNYQRAEGMQNALDSVARRLRRDNPLAYGLPTLLDQFDAMASGFDTFFPQLCEHVKEQARAVQ